ncbi:MAG: GLPGLI family protein [Flavobacteriaceae bacterium]|nr:GLPGLI family protein [Flavobacteriaceae bacterium]
MKNRIVLVILLIASINLIAQDFQGKAYYQSKTTVDMSRFGNREMSEDMKKRIAERMKSMLEKTYILTFNREEAQYKEEERLDAPGQGGGGTRFAIMGSFNPGKQYKNIKTNQFLQEQEFFGKQFLINDSLRKFEWVVGDETKQIGQYMCFKATAEVEASQFSLTSIRRGRTNNETAQAKDSANVSSNTDENAEDENRKMTITAWYSPQIPVSQGPGEYYGLPGLILEVHAGRTTILCTKIVLNPGEKETIKAPTKGKEVTRKEYDDIVAKKTGEMREMFRGRRGGNGIRIRTQ